MISPKPAIFFRTTVLAALITSSSAFSQSIWTGLGLDGNWSNDANWLGDVAPDSSASTALQFGGHTLLTPNTNSPWIVGSIAFNSGASAFTLGGSVLTLADGGAITNNSTNLQTIANSGITLGGTSTWNAASGDLRVSGAISGGAIVKTGAGNLELSGTANDFSTLAAYGGRITSSGTTTLGTLAVGAFGAPGTNGDFSLTGGTLNTSKGASNTTYVGGGAGNTGTMTISGGTLNVGLVSAPGTRADFEVGSFSGNGTVTQTGGALTLNSTSGLFHIGNQGTGVYSLQAGTITVKSAFALGRSNTSGLGNGTLNISGGSLTLSSSTKGALLIGGVDGTGAVNGGTGLIHQTGGTVSVGQYMEFGPHGGSGTYDLLGGTLEIGGTNGIRTGGAGSSYAFNLGAGTLKVIGGDLTTSVRANLVLGSAATILDTQGFNATWSGGFDGSGGALVKIGTGTLTLSTADSNFGYFDAIQGTTVLASGTTSSGEFVVGGYTGVSGALTMSGGQLTIAQEPIGGGTPSLRIGDFGGTGTFTQTGGLIDVNNPSGASMAIGNQGGVGTYALSSGTLHLGAGGLITLGRSAGANPAGNGTFNVSGNALVDVEGGRFIVGDDTTSANNGYGTVNQTGGTVRIGSAATLFLSGFAPTNGGTNTYNLSGGVLQVGGSSLKGVVNTPSPYNFNLGGGTIQVTGSDLTTSVTATLVPATASTIDTNGLNATFSGNFVGAGLHQIDFGGSALIKTGAGTLTLSGASRVLDSFAVTGGSVVQTTGATSSVEFMAGTGAGNTGSYVLNGGTLAINNSLRADNVTMVAGSLRVGDFSGTGTFTQNAGTLTVADNGALNIGNQGGTGVYNFNGGTINLNAGLHVFGRSTSGKPASTGTMNMSGGLLALDNGGKIILGNNIEGVGVLFGSGTLTQTGGTIRVTNGTLHVGASGNGTYNLNGGTLEVGGAGLAGRYGTGAAQGVSTFNLGGGTIKVIGTDLTTNVAATLSAASTSTIDTNGLNATFTGALGGAGSLTKTGAGTLVLTGTNSYGGGTTVNAGTLQLGNGGSLSWSGNVALANGAALAINSSSDLFSQNNVISGTGSFVQAGTGLLQLTGSNTYNGVTAIRSGVLEVFSLGNVSGSPAASGLGSPTTAANGTITLGSGTSTGTLRYSGNAAATTNRNIDLAGTTGGGVLEMNAGNVPGVTFTGTISSSVAGAKTLTLMGSNQGNISGVISGADVSLRVDGGDIDYAIWKLTGNNTFGGGVTVDHGDLWFNSNSLGLGTTVDFHGGALIYNGTNTTDLSLRTVTLHSDVTGLDVGSNNVTFTQAIGNSGAGGLRKSGTGTLTMQGANTYTGATVIDQGVLSVSTIGNGGVPSGIGAGGTAASNLVLAEGTLRYTGTGATTNRLFGVMYGSGTLDSSGTGALNFTNTGNIANLDGTLTTLALGGSNTGNNTIAGRIIDGDNTLSLAKTGAGTWILNGANAYTGSTTVNNGILRLGATGTLPPSRPLTINANSVGTTAWLDLNDRDASVSTLTFAGTGSTATSTAKLTTGTGTLTLGGNVTFSATGNSLGATLDGKVALGSSIRTFTAGDSTNAATDLAVSAVVSGAGGLTKSGAGTLLLSGANTYTGVTSVSAGTLTVTTLANVNDGASSLGAPTSAASGTIALGATTATGTLAYTGSGSTTDRVLNLAGTSGGGTLNASGSGAITFTSNLTATGAGSKTLTLTGTNTGGNTIGGAIVNNSGTNRTSVSKTGAGTWVLSGTSTYTGTTNVTAGTLKVSGSIATSSLTTVSGSGVLSGNGTVGAVTISSGGSISPGDSSGTLTTGTQTWGASGNYAWEINDPAGVQGASTGWDWLNINGALDITSSPAGKFVITISASGLDSLPNSATPVWTIATASGGINGFDPDRFLLVTSALSPDPSHFILSQNGNDLVLSYSAIPEPGSVPFAVTAFLAILVATRRRR